MSIIRAIKHRLGLSVTPANNFVLDASADNGTMKLARESGQDIMTVDAAGKVAFPQNSKAIFDADIFSTQTFNAGVDTVVQAQEQIDVGGVYSGNTFTAPVNGLYQFNLKLSAEAASGQLGAVAGIAVGGVARQTLIAFDSTNNRATLSASAMLYLTAGQQVTYNASLYGAAPLIMSSANATQRSRWSGFLVRAD